VWCWLLTYLYSGDAGISALETKSSAAENSAGGIERKSTRLWAEESVYDTSKLFNKARIFIKLLDMTRLNCLTMHGFINLLYKNCTIRLNCLVMHGFY